MIPSFIAVPDIPRDMTLESLQEEFDYSIVSPANAHKAVSIRNSISRECDAKGYETPEDTAMMAYLWAVRCEIVNHIIANEIKHQETCRAQQRAEITFDRMSQADKDNAYDLYTHRNGRFQ